MFVQVAVNVPNVNGLFDYHLPQHLESKAQPGCLAVVPFGRQQVQGIILHQVEQPQVLQTRPISDLIDEQPVLNRWQIQLAEWMSRQTFISLSECLHLMLPSGLSKQANSIYTLRADGNRANINISPFQNRILELLEKRGGRLTGTQLAKAFPHHNWKPAIQALIRCGILDAQSYLQEPTAAPKRIRSAQLACPPHKAEEALSSLGRGHAQDRRRVMLEVLIREYPKAVAPSWIYAAVPNGRGSLADLKVLEKKGLIRFIEEEEIRDPLAGYTPLPMAPPQLTSEQRNTLQTIIYEIEAAKNGKRLKPFLLHGVTGSGKTEIYLEAVKYVLEKGKGAIILIPEISLTPQTVHRFTSRFPGKVGIIHSRLSEGERFDTWRRARSGDLPIIIGPRSALFVNMPSLGLIIIDEFEDDSYFQSDQRPHYSAVRTSLAYGYLMNIPVILGSATPDISWKYRAEQDGWNILRLPSRILAHQASVQDYPLSSSSEHDNDRKTAFLPLPPVQVIDMREELKEGNRSIFSRSLKTELQNTLQRKEQAILFLNRRGSATYVFCRDCGKSLTCPNCEISLTYHESAAHLLCHTCNYRRKMPAKCPACGSANIRQYGTGTEKVEKELQLQFPQARILRLDAGTTSQKEAHNLILEAFRNHQADFLVGTQMIAKGLDLPRVTLVGVILADVGLHLPDFRANERVFQLLTQVAGRAGRSSLGGKVILQTFDPTHYVIQKAAKHDYEGFYRLELEKRRKIHYPPFFRLAKLEFRHAIDQEAEQAAFTLAQRLQNRIDSGGFNASEIIGPVPCYYHRRGRYYRWQVILRSPDPVAVLKALPLNGADVEVDPPSLL